jgi:SAM-dependent methyltransferase
MSPPETHDELWDLQALGEASRLSEWMYEQFRRFARGVVVEVGAGIGTFSKRLSSMPAVTSLTLIEPERVCVRSLEQAFDGDPRVTVVNEELPRSQTLEALAGGVDFLLCQNVLEHIDDERGAVGAMAQALAQNGRLTLLVPAHPRLYGKLDRRYGHFRRYTRDSLRRLVDEAGLTLDEIYSFNLLGVPGWWLESHRRSPQIRPRALRLYDLALRGWRPIEEVLRPPVGLSLVVHAHKD